MNNLSILRTLGLLEGVSYLLLLCVCTPLKYGYDMPEPTFFVGMAHGLLFVGYCIWVLMVASEYQRSWSFRLWAFIAALVPFGTFIADKKLFRFETGQEA